MGRKGFGLGGAPSTDGLTKFRAAIAKERQVETAKRLGVSQQLVSSIVRQKQRPSEPVRLAIQREYGVPSADWLTPAECKVAYGDGRSPPPKAA